MEEAIRTKQEKTLEIAFKRLEIPYLINQIYCFECGNYFEWVLHKLPELCPIGRHRMDGAYGKIAVPDFILIKKRHELGPVPKNSNEIRQTSTYEELGIIRVDGPIHEKKRIEIRDKFQTQNFLKRGIKVFVVDNSEIDGREPIRKIKTKHLKLVMRAPNFIMPPWIHLTMAKFFWDCMNNSKLYETYINDPDIKYRLDLP